MLSALRSSRVVSLLVVGGLLVAALLGSFAVVAQDAAKPEAKTSEVRFEVPDGPVEKIAAVMREARAYRPGRGVDNLQGRLLLLQAFDAVVTAADKLLAAKVDDALAGEAVQAKSEALGFLGQLGRGEANKQLEAFLTALDKDPRPTVQAALRGAQLRARLVQAMQAEGASAEQRQQAVAEINTLRAAWLKDAPKTPESLSLLLGSAQVLEQLDAAKEAAESYQQAAAIAKASNDPKVAAYAEKFEGSARRLQLVGQSLPIAGKQASGQPFDVSAWKGKVVLVDFWATWCGPCIRELPNLKANYDKYHGKGFEVVGISLDDDRDQLKSFLQQNELPWTILFSDDPQATGWQHPLAVKYGIQAIPAAILVDQQGKVVTLNARGEALGEWLAKLLGPSAP